MRVRAFRNDNQIEYFNIHSKYSYQKLSGWHQKRGKNKVYYADDFISLDTESSHNHDSENPIGWIYQWCFKLKDCVVGGRTPEHLMKVLRYIHEVYHLTDDRRIMIYVHNLSYDITYLYQFLLDTFPDFQPEVLAVASHKFLTFRIGGLEFRCSWLLSNMSLDRYSQSLNTTYRKLVGTVDYELIRNQSDKLTMSDWEYMLGDVLTLDNCIRLQLQYENDTIASIPLTSTGYVRRDCRVVCCHDKKYMELFKKSALDVMAYRRCKEAFGGGYVHTNRHKAATTIECEIAHFDFKSHYPSRQQLNYMPSKFVKYSILEDDLSLTKYLELASQYCTLVTVGFENLTLKDNYISCPYAQQSKILNSNFELYNYQLKYGTDNGRIVASKGWIVYTLTELDMEIFLKQYQFTNIKFFDLYIADRIQIPKVLQDVINDYFYKKENLVKDSYYYMKSKNKLNAIYGMSATDIIRPELEFSYDSNSFIEKVKSLEDIDEELQKYYSNRNNFMPYQWGVYTTAWARHELLNLIIGDGSKEYYDSFLYCDTDSIFFIDCPLRREQIEKYNQKVINECEQLGKFVINRKKEKSYYGTFEDEHEEIVKFRALHSKCYAFESKDGDLHVTIAGVTKDNKKLDDERVTIEQELHDINNMKEDFTFTECGGTKSVYTYSEISKYNGNSYASACIISKTTKTLSELGEDVDIFDWRTEED